MNKLNLELSSILLIALIVKSIVDGGSFPIAIAIVALLASQAYKAHLSKQKDTKFEEQQDEFKKIHERLGSLESKYALTMGSNRLK